MAIVFEKQHRAVNWFGLLSALFLVGFFAFAVYYLFFAPVPKIEAIIPPALKEASKFSQLEFIDPSTILENPKFRRLQPYVRLPGAGTLGRTNPFLPF